jgi:hypothetical protein
MAMNLCTIDHQVVKYEWDGKPRSYTQVSLTPQESAKSDINQTLQSCKGDSFSFSTWRDGRLNPQEVKFQFFPTDDGVTVRTEFKPKNSNFRHSDMAGVEDLTVLAGVLPFVETSKQKLSETLQLITKAAYDMGKIGYTPVIKSWDV